MKHQVIREEERGSADFGWLKAKHYFSFGSYYDEAKVSFGKLRVINDDLIAPGMGFATHPHKNMEIITIPLSGAVKHKDSEGNEGFVNAGEVQIMSAGKGIEHSEFNASAVEPLSLFQIWIDTDQNDIEPRYLQKPFELDQGIWTELVKPVSDEENSGLGIQQNAYITMASLSEGESLSYKLNNPESGVYIIAVDGKLKVEEESLSKRDALAVSGISELGFEALDTGRILVIETTM